jgi:hypothetical protein
MRPRDRPVPDGKNDPAALIDGKDKGQRRRFIGPVREAGASEDEAVFCKDLKRLALHKPKEDRELQK